MKQASKQASKYGMGFARMNSSCSDTAIMHT